MECFLRLKMTQVLSLMILSQERKVNVVFFAFLISMRMACFVKKDRLSSKGLTANSRQENGMLL